MIFRKRNVFLLRKRNVFLLPALSLGLLQAQSITVQNPSFADRHYAAERG
jgi:hypothetical protein